MTNHTDRHVFPFWNKLANLTMIQYHLELQKQLSDCESVLDIGCCGGSPIRYIPFTRAVGVELDEEYIKTAKKNRTHDEYVQADAKKIDTLFKPKEFDACVALDLIEHLTKKDGLTLIKNMERLAKKKIILFTPNGYMNQKNEEQPLQDHHSGWTAQEMKELGFHVVGMLGPKTLRTDQHVLKGNKYITGLVSEIAQFIYIHDQPEKAAAIMCIKAV
ncbi:hypothetical protein BH09PAT2_BH09PAT2_02460 [soil metagenome]